MLPWICLARARHVKTCKTDQRAPSVWNFDPATMVKQIGRALEYKSIDFSGVLVKTKLGFAQ